MQNISKILLILISILFLYGTSYASDDVNQKTHKILKPGFSFEDLVSDMVESDLELITNNL